MNQNWRVESGGAHIKARGQLDLLLERLDAITARGAPLLRPPLQAVGGEAPTSPSGSDPSRSAEIDKQNSDALDTEQAFQEHLESLAEPLPSGLWAEESQLGGAPP